MDTQRAADRRVDAGHATDPPAPVGSGASGGGVAVLDRHATGDTADTCDTADTADDGTSGQTSSEHRMPRFVIAAIASAAAAVMHAAAAGIHADHPSLSRLFVALTVAQGGAAAAAVLTSRSWAGWAVAAINAGAAAGWLVTRLTGISWVDGLEIAEDPQLADSIAAVLAAIAMIAAAIALRGWSSVPRRAAGNAALLAGILLVPGLAAATDHDHAADHAADHTADHTAGGAHDETAHDAGAGAGAGDATAVDHAHDPSATAGDHAGDHAGGSTGADAGASSGVEAASDDHHAHTTDDTATAADPAAWPRAWDPSDEIDFSGVPGVTAEQQARAEQLVRDTLRDLPAFADVTTIGALGYASIGDASTGFEHFVNYQLFGDGKQLDPTAPESLVYRVDGDQRTLVSAMFIVARTAIDDPALVDYGGPLMEWHVHDNLCWALDDDGKPTVVGVLEFEGDTCPTGSINTGGDNPMVHVWIAPHECGPFAALEGHGAGQTASDGSRTDQCAHAHSTSPPAATSPYDPTLPIDLGGVPGVTPQQQAFAENLVAATVRDLPQWADPAVAEAAGFRSIGDGLTGHEHFINWDWIDDDVWLDPDHPESLVYEPQPDGTRRLVSVMFMLPGGTAFDDIPDWGGALMQWHVHGDLCFTDDPVAPQVAGLKPVGTSCQPPLVDFPLSPMIHVWITPTPCGPFAALEGIAGGQVPDGEAILCDTAHGSH